MIIQLANIIAGSVLVAPKIAEFGNKEKIEALRSKILPYHKTIGGIELALGVIALIERIGLSPFHIYNLGSSYSQAIPAIFVGLILAATYFERTQNITSVISKLKPYSTLFGLWAIAAALISLFYGCMFCFFYY